MQENGSRLAGPVQPEDKPKRLYFDTYLAMIKNAPGTAMFRNFYLSDRDGSKFDAIENGSNACAYFVSSILVIFQKMKAVHGTVRSTVEDLQGSGWQSVEDLKPGDVIVWEATAKNDNHQHVGFYIGGYNAVSTSSTQRIVLEHQLHFGSEQRGIIEKFRIDSW